MIVQGKKVYVCIVKIDSSHMYATVKGKPVYAKEYIAWARVRPRNRRHKNLGKHRENRGEKTQYPKREIIPSGVANSVTRKISL
jgi:hypothetical protein